MKRLASGVVLNLITFQDALWLVVVLRPHGMIPVSAWETWARWQ